MDIEWSGGRVTRTRLRPRFSGRVRIRTAEGMDWQLADGTAELQTVGSNVVELTCAAGREIELVHRNA